jgi:hypothetical protein
MSEEQQQAGQPTEEEMQAAFEEQMRQIRVQDVILQSVATLVNLGARRLGLAAEPGQDTSGEVDIEQARLAIEGARALAPLCPPEQSEPIKQALSQLQMAYAAQAAPGQSSDTGPRSSGEPPAPPAPEDRGPTTDDEARAKARAKLWTPPGA